MVNKKTKKRASKERPVQEADAESPGAEVVTVAWLISVLSVAICDFGAGVTRLMLAPNQPNLALLSGVLFFAALTISLICLGLLPIVLRSRRVQPPRALVVFGVMVSVLPWVALIAQLI